MNLQEKVRANQRKVLADASEQLRKEMIDAVKSVDGVLADPQSGGAEIEAAKSVVLNDIAAKLEDFVFLLNEAGKQCEK